MQRFEYVRIYSMTRCSNIEYRTSSNIEPVRTLEIFIRSNHRISNIEPHRISNLFVPANIRSIEPLNIAYRTSNSNIHRMVQQPYFGAEERAELLDGVH